MEIATLLPLVLLTHMIRVQKYGIAFTHVMNQRVNAWISIIITTLNKF